MEFIYEKLDVWKQAIDFGMKVTTLVEEKSNDKLVPITHAASSSSINVSSSIAKGKSFKSRDDFAQHLYLSRGLVYETMSLMEILKRKKAISHDHYEELGEVGHKVAAMLSGLIKSVYKVTS